MGRDQGELKFEIVEEDEETNQRRLENRGLDVFQPSFFLVRISWIFKNFKISETVLTSKNKLR